MPSQFIPQLMELHRTGNFPIDRLCKIYNVENFHQALEDIEQGKVSHSNIFIARDSGMGAKSSRRL